MRAKIDVKQIRNLLVDLNERCQEWTSVKVIDYKGLLGKYELPIQGIVSSTLVKFLISKDILLERRRGRLGVSWKWNVKYPDFDSIMSRYQAHLNSLQFNIRQNQVTKNNDIIVKPREFELGAVIYYLHDNQIEKSKIIGKRLNKDSIIYQVSVLKEVDKDIIEVDLNLNYDQIHVTVDDLLAHLKEVYYKSTKS